MFDPWKLKSLNTELDCKYETKFCFSVLKSNEVKVSELLAIYRTLLTNMLNEIGSDVFIIEKTMFTEM
jgi:hypothetical protein